MSAPINDYFCTQNIPDSAGCPAEDSDGNSLCVSGICLGGESVGSGVCAGTRGGVGEACGENDDCERQVCNLLTKLCISQRLQGGKPCGDRQDCQSNVCAVGNFVRKWLFKARVTETRFTVLNCD